MISGIINNLHGAPSSSLTVSDGRALIGATALVYAGIAVSLLLIFPQSTECADRLSDIQINLQLPNISTYDHATGLACGADFQQDYRAADW